MNRIKLLFSSVKNSLSITEPMRWQALELLRDILSEGTLRITEDDNLAMEVRRGAMSSFISNKKLVPFGGEIQNGVIKFHVNLS
jgi:hypothetical protein